MVLFVEDMVHSNAIFERVNKSNIDNRKYMQNVIFTEIVVFNRCLMHDISVEAMNRDESGFMGVTRKSKSQNN